MKFLKIDGEKKTQN